MKYISIHLITNVSYYMVSEINYINAFLHLYVKIKIYFIYESVITEPGVRDPQMHIFTIIVLRCDVFLYALLFVITLYNAIVTYIGDHIRLCGIKSVNCFLIKCYMLIILKWDNFLNLRCLIYASCDHSKVHFAYQFVNHSKVPYTSLVNLS